MSIVGVQAGVTARAEAQRCDGAAASGRRLLRDRAVARPFLTRPEIEANGPFRSHAETEADSQNVALGPEAEITDGGQWDPAWNRKQ
jgi:hypothetical protein